MKRLEKEDFFDFDSAEGDHPALDKEIE